MSLAVEVQSISASLNCEAGSSTEGAFDVRNTSDRALRVGIEPIGDSKGWIALANKALAEFDLPPQGQQKVAVKVAVPADTEAKRYSFKMRIYDAATPTQAVESAAVAIDVTKKEAPKIPLPPTDEKKKNWVPIIVAASIGGLVLIGGIVGLILYLTHAAKVPDLIGKTAQEAGELLMEEKLPAPAISQLSTGEQEPGLVVRQDPAAGAEVPEDGVVSIVIEQLTVPVPGLRGLTVAAAETALGKAGLAMGEKTFQITGNSPGGAVIAQDPAENSPAIPGMAVKVTVERELVMVPPLGGLTFNNAKDRLAEDGLVIVMRQEVNGAGAPGTVAAQDPMENTPVERGQTVSVDIVAQKVAVPQVAGKTLDQATREVVGRQLVVAQILNRYAGTQEIGLVEAIEPGENTPVPVGTPVTLYVRALRPRFNLDAVAIPIQDVGLKTVLLQQTMRTREGAIRSVPPAEQN